ncbi:hypothetical protein GCM10023189_03830 [Nibrella saemangeumensis]|uniref:Signal transduction histidine kinase internal region domain-containing protein n=1 Tax=Nibrella saemangeumensis TaxID=1084526 RepID=A0ABP8MDU2_9BACT
MKIQFNKYVEWIILWIAVMGIIVRGIVLPAIHWSRQLVLFAATLLFLNLVWLFHLNFDHYLNRKVPFEQNVRKRVIIQLLVGWSVVKLVLSPIIILLVDEVTPKFPFVLNPLNVITIGVVAFLANLLVALGFIANHFLNRWRENAVRAARLEKEKSQVQYDNLKNQLNPHFLFNSLSSLDGLIEENPALARQFLRQLSKVYRYVLQNKDKELVPLDTELDFIQHYIFLLKTRFDGAFSVIFDIPDHIADKAIVPVTLQILIENAIKHNVINAAHPLTVQISADDRFLRVANVIQRRSRVEASNGLGLSNLKLLYSFLSPKPVDVQDDGERFCVRVPLLESAV